MTIPAPPKTGGGVPTKPGGGGGPGGVKPASFLGFFGAFFENYFRGGRLKERGEGKRKKG